MKRLLDRSNSFFMTLERMANFCILNVLTLVCCLPIITAGASLSAGCRVMQCYLIDGEQPIVKTFFEAFRTNFKQSTVLWLIVLLVLAFLGVDAVIVYGHFQLGTNIVMYIVLGVIAFLIMGTAAYAIPFITRYENTLRGHLDNAFYLVFRKLPRTFAMVVIAISPVLIFVCDPIVFAFTIPLWAVVGISSILYLETRLMMPVFAQLEADEEQGDAQ